MVNIQVDEQTAKKLEEQAKNAGLSVAEYLRALFPASPGLTRPSWDEIERELAALSTNGPSLPADFSRADIYIDHD